MNSLYLNVTDFCNMRCEYCYGNHGQYYKKKHFKNMSFKTACKAIEIAMNLYNHLRIVFFGGEPLLNFGLIEQLVKKYSGQAHFCIITNGLLLNDKILHFFISQNFSITISFEGNYEAQSFRKDANNRSTYSQVLERIALLDSMDWPYNIRMTLFRNNVDIGARLHSLENFKNIREIRVQFCSPTNSICDLTPSDMLEYTSNIESASESPLFNNCMLPQDSPHSNAICTMGITGFSVDTNGYVYPCYRFIGKRKFCLGHISNFSSKNLWCTAILEKKSGTIPNYCFADYYISLNE